MQTKAVGPLALAWLGPVHNVCIHSLIIIEPHTLYANQPYVFTHTLSTYLASAAILSSSTLDLLSSLYTIPLAKYLVISYIWIRVGICMYMYAHVPVYACII